MSDRITTCENLNVQTLDSKHDTDAMSDAYFPKLSTLNPKPFRVFNVGRMFPQSMFHEIFVCEFGLGRVQGTEHDTSTPTRRTTKGPETQVRSRCATGASKHRLFS